MGYGEYSHAAHVKMAKARSGKSRGAVFTSRGCHKHMNPLDVKFRESRDSDDHPDSIGIIFALDVSGSMGDIPARLATNTLPDFMSILEQAGVADPQVMFMAVGFAGGDSAPLQVGQFESSAELMDKWLTHMYLEGGGAGGNESYELAMYFAARHTAMDCVEKRQKRGYFFVTGDEPPNLQVEKAYVKGLIGDDLEQSIPTTTIIEELKKTYEPFYLIPDPGRGERVGAAWRELMGERLIIMGSPDDTSHVAAGLVALVEGASLKEVNDRYAEAGVDKASVTRVIDAIRSFAASLGQD